MENDARALPRVIDGNFHDTLWATSFKTIMDKYGKVIAIVGYVDVPFDEFRMNVKDCELFYSMNGLSAEVDGDAKKVRIYG